MKNAFSFWLDKGSSFLPSILRRVVKQLVLKFPEKSKDKNLFEKKKKKKN